MPVPSAITDLSTTAGSNYPAGSESPTTVDDYLRAHASFIAQLYATIIPPGTMLDFGGTAAPTGYLVCDGSAVSRTTYATLFAAVGTNWGVGDGSTTFNLPDMRRRASIGSGGTAVSGPANTVGSTGGEEKHSLTATELAAHNHGVSDPGHSHSVSDPGHTHTSTPGWRFLSPDGNNGTGSANGPAVWAAVATGVNSSTTGIAVVGSSTGVSTTNTGSGTPHNVMQPSAVVTKIIKT